MTREEAIARIKDHMEHHGIGKYPHIKLAEALTMAISALTPPTQEQMERVWRSTWTMIGADKRGRGGIFKCIKCERCYPVRCDFCPNCGRAMTPEAWEELRKRWEEVTSE